MGERSAVRPKSGQSVCESDPGLRRPTPPKTAGRKPAARPIQPEEIAREAGLTQPKIRRGAGQSPAVRSQREALVTSTNQPDNSPLPVLDQSQIKALAEWIKILHRWKREAHDHSTM